MKHERALPIEETRRGIKIEILHVPIMSNERRYRIKVPQQDTERGTGRQAGFGDAAGSMGRQVRWISQQVGSMRSLLGTTGTGELFLQVLKG